MLSKDNDSKLDLKLFTKGTMDNVCNVACNVICQHYKILLMSVFTAARNQRDKRFFAESKEERRQMWV